jgi:hypothetical protein
MRAYARQDLPLEIVAFVILANPDKTGRATTRRNLYNASPFTLDETIPAGILLWLLADLSGWRGVYIVKKRPPDGAFLAIFHRHVLVECCGGFFGTTENV